MRRRLSSPAAKKLAIIQRPSTRYLLSHVGQRGYTIFYPELGRSLSYVRPHFTNVSN